MKKIAMVLLALIMIAAVALLFTDYMRFGMFIIAFGSLSFSISRIMIMTKKNKEIN